MQTQQENKSLITETSGSSKKNIRKANDEAAFETYATQCKIKPYPEPRGSLAQDVILGGSLPDAKPVVQRKTEEEEPLQGKGDIQLTSQSPPVQLMKLHLKDGIYSKDDEKKVEESKEEKKPVKEIDTATLDREGRIDLVAKLKAQKIGGDKLLMEIQQEWREKSTVLKSDASDLSVIEDLFELSKQLKPIEEEAKKRTGWKLAPKPSKEKVGIIKAKIKAIIKELSEGGSTLTDVGRSHVSALTKRVSDLTGEKDLLSYGVDEEDVEQLSPEVQAEYRQAYREDTLEMGVWAGPAEADVLAKQNRISFDIFIVSKGKYRLAYPNIGSPWPKSARGLLFLGNHYVVLNNADMTDGRDVPEALPVVAATEILGDCLYEGIYILVNGHKPRDYEREISLMRRSASNTMNDAAVDASIALIRSGSAGGLGTKMNQLISQTNLLQRQAKLSKVDGYKTYRANIDSLFKEFASKKIGKPKDQILVELEAEISVAETELIEEDEIDDNPLSKPHTLYRWVSTADGKEALKNGIAFDADGGGIPTSTKGLKGIAITSGAVFTDVLLIIDTSKIPNFRFEYVPTRSKLKEVKIKCKVPPEAIKKG